MNFLRRHWPLFLVIAIGASSVLALEYLVGWTP